MSVEKFCERMERLELREDHHALVRDCDLDALLRVFRAAEAVALAADVFTTVPRSELKELRTALDALPVEGQPVEASDGIPPRDTDECACGKPKEPGKHSYGYCAPYEGQPEAEVDDE